MDHSENLSCAGIGTDTHDNSPFAICENASGISSLFFVPPLQTAYRMPALFFKPKFLRSAMHSKVPAESCISLPIAPERGQHSCILSNEILNESTQHSRLVNERRK
jgi:hypothetical protein